MLSSLQIINKRTCLLPLALFMLVSVTAGQDMQVRAVLDTTKAFIGDQLKLHISLEKPERIIAHFPALQDTLTANIEILSKSDIDTALVEQGRILLSQDLLIAVFDTGFFEIPPLPFAFQHEQFTDTLSTTPLYFEIVSLPLDTTIRDIRANLKTPVNVAEILPFAVGLIALAVISLVMIYWIRKKMHKGITVPSAISAEPADVIALRELAQLREEKSWAQKQVKLYYIRLTEILRRYIERRFGIMALEQTTDEILASLRASANGEGNIKRLSGILRLADLVKFAKVIPDPDENVVQLDEAVAFVSLTAPPKAEPVREASSDHEPVQSNVES